MSDFLLVLLVAWSVIAFPAGYIAGSRNGFREADRRLRGAIARRRSLPYADRTGRPLRRVYR